jgi:hypothetical protein
MTDALIMMELPRVATGQSPMLKAVVYAGNVPMIAPSADERHRQEIIRKLVMESSLYVGMRVKPARKSTFDKQGYAVVMSIARTYKEWLGNTKPEDAKWPKNDNPMLVHAKYEEGGNVVDATMNYFIPAGDVCEED